MITPSTPSIVDVYGQRHEVNLNNVNDSVLLYKEAFDKGLTLPQFLEQKYPTNAAKDGSAFAQLCATSGLVLKYDQKTGLRPSTMADMLNGFSTEANVVRPDGSQALTVAGRLLFPAVILQWIESRVMENYDAYEGVYNRMVALTSSAASPRVDQPIVNLTAPRSSLANPIAQMSEPNAMVSISLSDKSYRIPTFSIGFEIADEALKNTTIDFVGMTLQQQIIGQRISLINGYINAMINGDTDSGVAALGSVNASSYDSAVTSGVMTNKAWVKLLREDYLRMNYTFAICDIDSYLAIENRTGRPTVYTDAGNDIRLTSIPKATLPGIPGAVEFFIVDTSIVGANTVVLIDPSKAIHKMVYVGGQYSAVEQYVMRRTQAMRFDFAEMSTRLYYNGDGWKRFSIA